MTQDFTAQFEETRQSMIETLEGHIAEMRVERDKMNRVLARAVRELRVLKGEDGAYTASGRLTKAEAAKRRGEESEKIYGLLRQTRHAMSRSEIERVVAPELRYAIPLMIKTWNERNPDRRIIKMGDAPSNTKYLVDDKSNSRPAKPPRRHK